MTVLNILSYPDPILRKVSEPVVELTQIVRDLIQNMKETMIACGNAIGLSAIQVGVPLRIIIVDKGDGNLVEYINPEIIECSGKFSVQEGCLSFAGISDGIPRYKQVTFNHARFYEKNVLEPASFKAFEPSSISVMEIVTDLQAVVVQHEIDHLNGILMYDHMTSILQKKVDKIFKVKA